MFFETDYPAMMLDFGYVVEDARGERVLGILSQEDIVSPDSGGDNIVRSTVLTVPTSALLDVEEGDTLRTWAQDAPDRIVTWDVRRVLLRQDGTPTRLLLAVR